jgi:sec-independent protein translocase protein TatA
MAGLGVPELVIIFLIVIVLFGSSRLPQVGRGLGELISNFKRGLKAGDEPVLPEVTKEDAKKDA